MTRSPPPTDPSPPLDHPTPERPHRVYLALTNHCNRSCPWCATFSGPGGRSWLTREALEAALPPTGPFEAQLEGGEPTLHPRFWEFVAQLRHHPRCQRLILSTNGTTLPLDRQQLEAWLTRFGPRFTLKLSLNHPLLERDPHLWEKARRAARILAPHTGARLLVINARYRPHTPEREELLHQLGHHGLLGCTNLFPLQRQGRARDQAGWEPPFLVGWNFRLVAPDGTLHGTDLVARSAAMEQLP